MAKALLSGVKRVKPRRSEFNALNKVMFVVELDDALKNGTSTWLAIVSKDERVLFRVEMVMFRGSGMSRTSSIKNRVRFPKLVTLTTVVSFLHGKSMSGMSVELTLT